MLKNFQIAAVSLVIAIAASGCSTVERMSEYTCETMLKTSQTTAELANKSGCTKEAIAAQEAARNRDFNAESNRVIARYKIQPVPGMKPINAPYVALKNSNVRSAPNTKGEVVGQLLRGDQFSAMASADGWIAIERDGALTGWVYGNLVQNKTDYLNARYEAAAKQKAQVVSAPAPVQKPVTQQKAVALPVSMPAAQETPKAAAVETAEATPSSSIKPAAAPVSAPATPTAAVSEPTPTVKVPAPVPAASPAPAKVEPKPAPEPDIWGDA